MKGRHGRKAHSCDILLVNPRHAHNHYFTQPELVRIMHKKNSLAPLSLALLAALTPDAYSVSVHDEDVAPFDPDGVNAKLAGIKAVTPASVRAYAIADSLRKRGTRVVFGGPHITEETTSEALQHADSVVLGEAEALWPELLNDFASGRMKQVYSSPSLVPYKDAVMPRWDLFDTSAYLSLPVQASRGCPYNCEFCNVSATYGRTVRVRNVDNVVREVASLPLRRIFFVDDNISINRRFARDLMQGLAGMDITWFCQASIDISDDAALLSAMAGAGCENILVGFESLNAANLRDVQKLHNLQKNYAEAVRKINAAGIHVQATFMIGLDNDTLDDVARLHAFCLDAPLPFAAVSFIAAAPGTRLRARVAGEGRLLPVPTEFNGGLLPSIRHPTVPPQALYDAFVDVLQRMYGFDSVYAKAVAVFGSGNFSKAKKDAEVTLSDKLRLGALLVGVFLFSRDKWRRKLFGYLFGQIGAKTIAPERAVIFLLTMHAYSISIRKMVREKGEKMKLIKGYSKEI